jgi:hypothetical protein
MLIVAVFLVLTSINLFYLVWISFLVCCYLHLILQIDLMFGLYGVIEVIAGCFSGMDKQIFVLLSLA